jgi:hypothetical protein
MRRAFYIVHEYWETISELEHDCLPKAISVCTSFLPPLDRCDSPFVQQLVRRARIKVYVCVLA